MYDDDDYLENLRQINNEMAKQQSRENFLKYLKDNLFNIFNAIIAIIALIVAIVK